MTNIVMYSTAFCGYCQRARNLFERKGVEVRGRDVLAPLEPHVGVPEVVGHDHDDVRLVCSSDGHREQCREQKDGSFHRSFLLRGAFRHQGIVTFKLVILPSNDLPFA